NVGKGTKYKYHIISRIGGYQVDKADPFGVHHETPPQTASIVWDLDYKWNDGEWMRSRKARKGVNPQTGDVISIKASRTVGFKAAPVLKKGL
ncbi:MAG: HU family DNA-binding protein, partial [Candidatus Binatia bacterium]